MYRTTMLSSSQQSRRGGSSSSSLSVPGTRTSAMGNNTSNNDAQPEPAASATQPLSANELTSPTTLRKLVLNYLLHHCYVDTAQAFVNDGSGSGSGSSGAESGASEASGSGSGSAPVVTAASSSSTSRPQHPLSAPPLSRLDSQMEVEEDSQLASVDEAAADDVDEVMRDGEQEAGDHDLSPAELRQVRQRQEIRDHILAGRIRHATELLNTHFPSVLNAGADTAETTPTTAGPSSSPSAYNSLSSTSLAPHLLYKGSTTTVKSPSTSTTYALPSGPTSLDPQHLSLNLQIQAFIESVRSANATPAIQNGGNGVTNGGSTNGSNSMTLPTSNPAAPGVAAVTAAFNSRASSPAPSSVSSASSSASHKSGVPPALHSALGAAQQLYSAIQRLKNSPQKDLYRRESEAVTAMLAYKDLEHSPVRKYLDVKRRKLLADQINSAIMFRSGRPAQPLIESAVRQTTFVWSQLHNEQIPVPQDHPVYTTHVHGGSGGGSSVLNLPAYGAPWVSDTDKKGKGKVPSTFHLPNFLAER